MQRCGLGPGTRLLEIGAGSGLATARLLAEGADVVAVEPGERLAAHLEADLGGDRLSVLRSGFETVDLGERRFDLAVAATAFHWVDRRVAIPKLAGVLEPPGWLAVWWHVFSDRQRPTEFRERLDGLFGEYLPDQRRDPSYVEHPLRADLWSAELEAGGFFEVVEVELIRWQQRLRAGGARRLFGSFPSLDELPPARREAFLDAIAALVDQSYGGEVADPRVTAIYLARLR